MWEHSVYSGSTKDTEERMSLRNPRPGIRLSSGLGSSPMSAQTGWLYAVMPGSSKDDDHQARCHTALFQSDRATMDYESLPYRQHSAMLIPPLEPTD